jgi:hypothetical protein
VHRNPNRHGRIYLAFTDGDYYYLVGEDGRDLRELKKAALSAAAVHLYRQVHM